MSLRVAVVSGLYPTPRHPQRGLFVRDQVDALRAAGHDVRVVHHEPPTLREVARRLRVGAGGPPAAPAGPSSAAPTRPAPAPRVTLPRRALDAARHAHDAAGQAVASRRIVADLAALTREGWRPDIVHAHNVFPAGRACLTASLPDAELVITEHSSGFLRAQYSPVERRQAAAAYLQADAVVAVSTVQAAALPGIGVTGRVQVVPNVVAVDDFALRDPDAAAGGAIVSIGHLLPHKGMAELVHAYATLPPRARAAHPLRIVGQGPARADLTTLASRLGVGDRVHLTGGLDRAGVARELGRAALLVSASPVETFGVTLVEGLAAGVPFVAARSGGPQDIWREGDGVLAPTPDRRALAAAIAIALDDLPTGPAADAERRRGAIDRYGPAAVGRRLTDLYDEVRADLTNRRA